MADVDYDYYSKKEKKTKSSKVSERDAVLFDLLKDIIGALKR